MANLTRYLGAFATALAAACGGGGDSASTATPATTSASTTTSAMQASVLACSYEHVFVTVVKVRAYTRSAIADADELAFELAVAPPGRIDLSHLVGGVLHELNLPLLPPGEYTALRLFLASDDSAAGAPPNAVQLAGGPQLPLATPGAEQSGLKLPVDVAVPAGRTGDVVVQFDACRSVTRAGNSGRYLLEPLLAGTAMLDDNAALRGERMVSTLPGDLNAFSAVGALPGGGYVIAWYFLGPDAGISAIRMRRFDASGATVGPEVTVSTSRAGQSDPHLAVLQDGGYVVAWAGIDYSSLLAQRFDAGGAAVGGETRINTMPLQWMASGFGVDALADGGYAFAWAAQEGGVYQRRFDSAGTASAEARVSPAGDVAWRLAHLAGLPDGGWVVTWTSQRQDGSGLHDVYALRFDAAGAAVGVPARVNDTSGPNLYATAIAALRDGGWVIVWNLQTQPITLPGSTAMDVYAKRFDAAGHPAGAEALVNTTTLWEQEMPSVAALADGGYVITWDAITAGVSGWDIDAQRFTAGNARFGGEKLVNTTTFGNQQRGAVAGLTDGGYVVAWSSLLANDNPRGIFMQRFAADDTPM